MEIYINSNKGKEVKILLDDEDYEKIKDWKFIAGRYITITKKDGPLLYSALLHRYIMKCQKNMVVDHINGDTYDNRKENLRIINSENNAKNRRKNKKAMSKYFGVVYNFNDKKWQVKVGNVYLGKYKNEIDAAYAHDTYIRKINDKYHKLNFPNDIKNVEYIRKNNKRKYKGVVPEENKWRVSFMYNGKIYTAGKCFETEEDAAKAYNNIIIQNKLNKPLNQI